MATNSWNNTILGGVKIRWIAIVAAFYLFNGFSYLLTLAINESAYSEAPFIDILWNYSSGQVINYVLKFVVSIPFVFLYFRWIKHWHLYLKIVLHVFTLIVYVVVWKKLFYFTLESLGMGHLEGGSEVWDIYIPALLYVIQFSLFHAFEYYYQYQQQKETEHQLRQISLQNELSAIKAQLNPHFLYNVFNAINASVPPEQERTREMIADLSDLFRYQLKASKQELVPLHEELDFIKKYLDLEKERFGERLNVTIDIDDDLLQQKIPSMLIQPLIENSLKHGLASKIEGGSVFIAVKQQNDGLYFEVKDTGIGVQNLDTLLTTSGIGLKNTQLRLEKLYGTTLCFEHNLPTGLRIYFEIKKEKLI